MTPARKRLLLRISAILGGVVLVLIIAAILVLQSSWFQNFVRDKIIAVTEESTGGKVELSAFEFDLSHLTARIRNFVLHGKEPANAAPLARVALLEIRLKLFSGLKKAIDIRYLGIDTPQVNFMVFPDGTTNVPEPKTKKPSSNKNGLQTVVDLAVGEFRIDRGLLQYSQQKTAFAARGENLRLLLNYNPATPSYDGNLSIDPVRVSSGTRSPLEAHVNLPLTIERDAVRLTNGRIGTNNSQILLTAGVRNMQSPQISARLNASISIPELAQSFALPLDVRSTRSPKTLTAEASVETTGEKVINVRSAHIGLGRTSLQAAGTLDSRNKSTVDFQSSFDLSELAALFKVGGVQLAGALDANGAASLDRQNNYIVDGTLQTKSLLVRSGTTQIRDASLSSQFHADPFLLSLDSLRLNALGGSMAAKIFIEKMRQLSVEARLRNFSVPVLAATLAGKPAGYDGAISGTLNAKGDLTAKGTSGYVATADLRIAPIGSGGVPLRGRIEANYDGPRDSVNLVNSFLGMPSSRLDLSGTLNQRIDVHLISHNLDDFLPAANMGSKEPLQTLPVTLQGGIADLQATAAGKLSAPKLQAHMAVTRVAVEGRLFDRLALDAQASPSGAQIANGLLTRNRLDTRFDASLGLSRWTPLPQSPVSANVTIRNADVADLLSLAGQTSVDATGTLSGDVHINGTYGNPVGSAGVQIVNASAYGQPVDHVTLNANLADQLVTLSNFEVAAADGKLNAYGTFRHPRESFSTGHLDAHVRTANIQLANLKPLQDRSPGSAGAIQLVADVAGDLRETGKQTQFQIANVSADLSARALRVQKQDAGDLTATARTVGRDVTYHVSSDFAGSDIKVDGRTALTANYPTTADAAIRDLSVEKALQIVGQGSIPASGHLSADAHVAGTVNNPDARLQFALNRANVYQEAINRFTGNLHYTNTLVDIPSIQLEIPAGSVNLHGSFTHPANNFQAGSLNLKLDSSEIQVARIQHVAEAKPGLDGVIRLAADIAGTLRQQNGRTVVQFSRLNADASANDLRVGTRALGHAALTAHNQGDNVTYRFDSDIASSRIHADGTSSLTGDYNTRARLSFSNLRYSNLAPFIQADYTEPPRFDALVEGSASINGPLTKFEDLKGALQLDRLEARSAPRGSPTGAPPVRTVAFQNEGPVQIALDRSVVEVKHFDIQGPKTSLIMSGAMNLKSERSPLDLSLKGRVDLSVLQQMDKDFYSSGTVLLNTVVRGTLGQPLLNGQIELQKANVNYADSPNGLSNGNGVILLNGTSATIQNLTGESGGGKIALTGFAGYSGRAVNFNVKASATRVRVRTAGISVTSDANLSLVGNTRRSLASGLITIHKIAYGASSDAGSFLSAASTPPSTPSAPSPLLAGMRLDIRIVTGSDLRVVTSYADRLGIEANLALRGTPITPGMLGSVRVTDGQLVFFGNQYTVQTGTVNFYNPTAIQPVVNLSLETIAQNVSVILGVSGPMNNLALTYRSDPPLTFQQIVQLLATNTTPADPTIAARQPNPPQQSMAQMGSSAILSQAVANPLASRVQRVFGLSSFKIDPSVAGANGNPTAKVTLQQRIASNITFTYITDVTQTNSQIIRVEWAFTPKLSAIALRDFNGNVSVQFAYKFKVE